MHRKDQIVFRGCKAALLSAPLLAFLVPATAVAQDARLADTAKEASNRTLIADAFARWSAGTGNVFSLLADDVVWHITGLDPAVAQTYKSRQALLDAAASPLRSRLSKPLKPMMRRIWADGDDVLVHWDGAAPFRDGSQYRNTYLQQSVLISVIESARTRRLTADG
jgi:ketosteroid isomerase-like protein